MTKKAEKWIRMELPYACFAVIIEDEKCVSAPPIAKWMIGRKFDEISLWVFKRGGTILEME